MKKIVLLVTLLFMLLTTSTCCDYERKEVLGDPRFTKVEEFLFCQPGKYDKIYGTIYEDKTTGVKYLYIWAGSGSGGPALTRYWDK